MCMHFMKILTVYTLNSHFLTLTVHNQNVCFCRPLKYLKPQTNSVDPDQTAPVDKPVGAV